MIAEKLTKFIQKGLQSLGSDGEQVILEHPADITHGDFSTNIALIKGKETGTNPKELAEKIVEYLQQNLITEVAKVEVAGPGFINIFLSRTFFTTAVQTILTEGNSFGRSDEWSGKKVMVEYTDPNPFKEFHIGHLMSNTIGEAFARLVEWNGAITKRANYQGDVGMHVAKAIWGMRELSHAGKIVDTPPLLGAAYALGAQAYEENEITKQQIDELNKKIYDQSDGEVNALYDAGRKISLDYFETIYAKLGTKFDYYFFESESGPLGKELVLEFLKKGVFEKSDGAVIFRGEAYGLHTRVFLNSAGLPVYEAKELALAKMKYDRFPYDVSIVVTGNEIAEYFKVLLKAMEQVYPELARKIVHRPHGMLRLPTGKMSSRTGDVITAESLILDIEKRLQTNIGKEMNAATLQQVAIGALKYSILRQSIGKDIIFDFDTSLSFEGDSGPYLQYTHARTRSISEKAEQEKVVAQTNTVPEAVSLPERLLYRFPEVVRRAGADYAPNYIATFLIELSSAWNSYYAQQQIVDAHDHYSPYRVALAKAVTTVLKNGLSVLGIEAPDHM